MEEKKIEDFICENPRQFFLDEILGRQIQLPHGILDLLGIAGYQLFVIELKAVPLKERDIGQVLRYTFDVKDYLTCAGTRYYRDVLINEEPLSQKLIDIESRRRWKVATGCQCPTDWDNPSVVPCLIGASVDDKVLSAADAAGIEVYRWEYFAVSDEFQFTMEFFGQSWEEENSYRRSPPFPSWVDRAVNYIADSTRQEVEYEFDRNCRQLLGIEDGGFDWTRTE